MGRYGEESDPECVHGFEGVPARRPTRVMRARSRPRRVVDDVSARREECSDDDDGGTPEEGGGEADRVREDAAGQRAPEEADRLSPDCRGGAGGWLLGVEPRPPEDGDVDDR